MDMNKTSYILILIPLIVLILAGCISEQTRTSDEDRFRYSVNYHPFEVNSTGYFDEEGNSAILISVKVFYSSLVFEESDGDYNALGNFEVAVYGVHDDSETFLENFDQTFQVSASERTEIESFKYHTLDFFIPLDKNEYEDFKTIVSLVNQAGSQVGVRTQTTRISRKSDIATISSVLASYNVDGDSDRRIYSSSHHIPSVSDSIHFEYFIENKTGGELEVISTFSKIESDTMFARLLGGPSMRGRSIAMRGVNYSEMEKIQTISNTVFEPGITAFQSSHILPERGNYRFEVVVKDERGNRKVRAFHDFNIVPDNYPAIQNVREMAAPLAYLMTDSEYQKLMSISTTDSLRRAVDTFWLENIGNARKAADVIRLYYSRVEEANLMFSSFKEGWRTDMGKVYILFGAPWYIDATISSETWIYGYNRNDPRYVYEFERPTVYSRNFPFEHFTLNRRRVYQDVEFERIRDWLNGDILLKSM